MDPTSDPPSEWIFAKYKSGHISTIPSNRENNRMWEPVLDYKDRLLFNLYLLARQRHISFFLERCEIKLVRVITLPSIDLCNPHG